MKNTITAEQRKANLVLNMERARERSARIRAEQEKKQRAEQDRIMQAKLDRFFNESIFDLMDDCRAEQEAERRAEQDRERRAQAIDARRAERSRERTEQRAESAQTCFALSFVRPSVFNRFEQAILFRERIRERAEQKTRSARLKAVCCALYRAEQIQPTTTTDCFKPYKPHMKQLKVFRLHNGKYHIVKNGLVPVRFHVEQSKKHFVGTAYKFRVFKRGELKAINNPCFVVFPNDKPFSSSYMAEIAGEIANERAIDFVIRALKTNFQQSAHPMMFLLLMQANRQKYMKNALDYNCSVQTVCRTSKRYKDALTGKMMQREREKLVQEIILDEGKELDFTGKIKGETKANKEQAVFQDVQDLIGIASKRIVDLMQCGAVQIPSDIWMQRRSIYSAINNYIDTSKERWKYEQDIVISADDGEEETELYIDAPTMRVSDEYFSHVDGIMQEVKAITAEHTTKHFQLDNAVNAYFLSIDYDFRYIAQLMQVDEKQVRRWINTVNDSLHHTQSIERIMANVL